MSSSLWRRSKRAIRRVAARALAAQRRSEKIRKVSELDKQKLELFLLSCNAMEESAAALNEDDRISFAFANGDKLVFVTNWIKAEIEGETYHVGTFLVIIDPEVPDHYTGPYVWCLDSGVKSKFKYKSITPQYVYSTWDPPSFCLGSGSRKNFSKQLLEEGEFLQLAYLLLDSFEHVNPSDYRYVKDEYLKDLDEFPRANDVNIERSCNCH